MNDHTVRIIQIMQEKKMNATQFSNAIGIQRTKLSHITSGRNNPSANVLTKIIERFADINPSWLLNGKGIMKIEMETPDSLVDEHQLYNDHLPEVENSKNIFPLNKDADLFAATSTSEYAHPNTSANPTRTPQNMSANPSVHTQNSQNKTPIKDIICTKERPQDKNCTPEAVNQMENSSKIIEKEVVIYRDTPAKTIEKLVIFFSDKTFETFVPELAE